MHVAEKRRGNGDGEIRLRGFSRLHYEAFACPHGLSWLHQVQQGLGDGGGNEQPLFGSLKLMREPASTNAAQTDTIDRR